MMIYKIKEIRESLGMSQEELSKKSSVNRTTISGLESGTIANTTASTISKIAEALGVQVSDIFFTNNV